MPTLVILMFAILLGWPLVKLVATIASRPLWDRQRRLKAELEDDPRYGRLEHRVVAETFQEGKGTLVQLALPFVAFFGGLALVVGFSGREMPEALQKDETAAARRRLFQIDYPEASETTYELFGDDRFQALSRRAFELQMLRYPIVTFLTAFAIFPSLATIAIFHGLRSSLRHAARGVVESSQQTVKTFATLITITTTAP